MIRRITRIAPWQAGKFFAVLYFLLGFVFAIPVFLVGTLSPSQTGQPPPSLGFALALPFIYAVGGFILVPIACWIFNLVARLIGGIEIEVTSSEA